MPVLAAAEATLTAADVSMPLAVPEMLMAGTAPWPLHAVPAMTVVLQATVGAAMVSEPTGRLLSPVVDVPVGHLSIVAR